MAKPPADFSRQEFPTAAVDAYVADAMQKAPIPGIALGVVQGSEIVYLKGYGTAGPGRAVTPQTPFMLGSVGKCFTALAVMQLAEQGKIDLAAPLYRYLPEFHTADDAALWQQITINHLINHTSGFTRQQGAAQQTYDPSKTLADLVAYASTLRLGFTPGGEQEYSNLNYTLLGAVIEKVSSQPYDVYVQQHIFDPLQMNHAHYSFESARADNLAQGYRIMWGLPVPLNDEFVPAQRSAGYVYVSAEDMARYLIPNLNDGDYPGGRIVHSVRPAQFEGKPSWLDVYWQWIPGQAFNNLPFHEGGTNAGNTALLLYPDQKLGIILLMNTRLTGAVEDAPSAATIGRGVADIVLGRTPQPVDAESFNNYYRTVNLINAVPLALCLFEFASALALWPRWLKKAKKPVRTVFWGLTGLDLLLAIGTLILTPLQSGYSWWDLVRFGVDYSILRLVMVLFLLAAGLIKVGKVWSGRKQEKAAPTPSAG